jgi:hypothetical protein
MTPIDETLEALDGTAEEAIKFALSAYTSENSRLMKCDLGDAVSDIMADLTRAGFTIKRTLQGDEDNG